MIEGLQLVIPEKKFFNPTSVFSLTFIRSIWNYCLAINRAGEQAAFMKYSLYKHTKHRINYHDYLRRQYITVINQSDTMQTLVHHLELMIAELTDYQIDLETNLFLQTIYNFPPNQLIIIQKILVFLLNFQHKMYRSTF